MYDLIVRKSSATEWIENAKNGWRIKLLSWQVVEQKKLKHTETNWKQMYKYNFGSNALHSSSASD